MTIEIKNIDGRVLYTSTASSVRVALEEAVAARTNLGYADLGSANLRSANLGSANLGYADLGYADLGSANLGSANLRSANLRSANLRYADLRYADLRYADLRSANLGYADLGSAINAELAIAQTRILPEGKLVGWKKLQNGAIAKLSIPARARRSHAAGRKCRAEYADVVAIFDTDGTEITNGFSQHDCDFAYVVGERVIPDGFDDDMWNECSTGIHFFITREEAEAY